MITLYTLTVVVVTWVSTLVKTYLTVHFKWVPFIFKCTSVIYNLKNYAQQAQKCCYTLQLFTLLSNCKPSENNC